MPSKATQTTTTEIITANRLGDGLVIFLTTTGWSANINAAEVSETKDATAVLLARAEADAGNVVGPYAVAVTRQADGSLHAQKYREALRTRGPSVRTDLGYQAA
ncbi:MAG: DUF2849 domain-containing protein [Minwuia sp.]|nr:DUF2849 domain-containing protein [Minwuia sp.]